MASGPGTSKQSSRWGSFLQQAVAGVESRLDTILAEPEHVPQPTKPTTEQPALKGGMSATPLGSPNVRTDGSKLREDFLKIYPLLTITCPRTFTQSFK